MHMRMSFLMSTDIPSYGDIQVSPFTSLVTIYMGPEGINSLPLVNKNWGTLSGQHIGDKDLVVLTLCRQMGYENGTIWFSAPSPDDQ